jgi:hypothetical protein
MRALAKKITKGLRYGTLFMSLQKRLYKTGININPFYLVREHLSETAIPMLNDNLEDYRFEFLTSEDIRTISQEDIIRGEEAEYNEWLAKGWKCLGAKHKGKVVAFGWIDLEECHFSGYRFRLKNNEAYLFSMYTAVPFRGKNIAAYLRYETYKALKKIGKDTYYSISEVFNKPSIRFKQKLDAKFLKKVLYIELFKKIRIRIPLKTYKPKN